jgi:hypothetical protein
MNTALLPSAMAVELRLQSLCKGLIVVNWNPIKQSDGVSV